jgi:hypothetical protein
MIYLFKTVFINQDLHSYSSEYLFEPSYKIAPNMDHKGQAHEYRYMYQVKEMACPGLDYLR